MLGHIESYDEACQTGVVKHEDQYFEFHIDQWSSESPPKPGDDIDFDHEDGKITDISLVGAYLVDTKPVKSRIVASLLGIILGALGAHRIYLGFYRIAAVQIAVTLLTGGYGVLWGFTEGVLIFFGHINKDAKGRFLK